jgi:hypothetical protein
VEFFTSWYIVTFSQTFNSLPSPTVTPIPCVNCNPPGVATRDAYPALLRPLWFPPRADVMAEELVVCSQRVLGVLARGPDVRVNAGVVTCGARPALIYLP